MSEITHEQVAARLVRALRLDTVMRDEERLALRSKVMWPGYVHDRSDRNSQAENYAWLKQLEADEMRRRSWDTRPAREDYLDVMGWLVEAARIGGSGQRTVRRRQRKGIELLGHMTEFCRRVALDWDWHSIARWEHKVERPSDYQVERARRHWHELVVVIADVANGRIGALGGRRVERAA